MNRLSIIILTAFQLTMKYFIFTLRMLKHLTIKPISAKIDNLLSRKNHRKKYLINVARSNITKNK